MAFTTGIIVNGGVYGNTAASYTLSISNESLVNGATIQMHAFYVNNLLIREPLYQFVFFVPANTIDLRNFSVFGFIGYEVQYQATTPTPNEVVATVFALDINGNLIANQKALQSEMTFLPQLTPIP
ncbi:hypothetical protein SY83_02820 [Paenibacillus swuensis]|uniref:Cohesin domain-containing protein n=1 Tax=Paenibacillus swuensis TaxID=1178515 RepID=A0A172TF76_9BACL|nr:hypothetical protein [Paenibacillus swuensis]ANE45433.1 hypothetical protein SY83_02820 [Paenibacillus swuensis]